MNGLEFCGALWVCDGVGSSPFSVFFCFFVLVIGWDGGVGPSLSSGRGCLGGMARSS